MKHRLGHHENIFIFNISENLFWIKVSKYYFILFDFENRSTACTVADTLTVQADTIYPIHHVAVVVHQIHVYRTSAYLCYKAS